MVGEQDRADGGCRGRGGIGSHCVPVQESQEDKGCEGRVGQRERDEVGQLGCADIEEVGEVGGRWPVITLRVQYGQQIQYNTQDTGRVDEEGRSVQLRK